MHSGIMARVSPRGSYATSVTLRITSDYDDVLMFRFED
jgi:hypothetical protein